MKFTHLPHRPDAFKDLVKISVVRGCLFATVRCQFWANWTTNCSECFKKINKSYCIPFNRTCDGSLLEVPFNQWGTPTFIYVQSLIHAAPLATDPFVLHAKHTGESLVGLASDMAVFTTGRDIFHASVDTWWQKFAVVDVGLAKSCLQLCSGLECCDGIRHMKHLCLCEKD